MKEDAIREREENLLRLNQEGTRAENALNRKQALDIHKESLKQTETLQEAKIKFEEGLQTRKEISEMDKQWLEGQQKLEQIRETAKLTPHKEITSAHLITDEKGNDLIIGVKRDGKTEVLWTGGKNKTITAAELKFKETGLKLAIEKQGLNGTDDEINAIREEYGLKRWERREIPGQTVKTGGFLGIGEKEEPVTTFGPASSPEVSAGPAEKSPLDRLLEKVNKVSTAQSSASPPGLLESVNPPVRGGIIRKKKDQHGASRSY